MKIDISRVDKAAVLAALFNASAPRGMGILHAASGPQVMTLEDARKALVSGDDLRDYRGEGRIIPASRAMYFDYLFGRPLKINLGTNVLDARLYDRDNPDALMVLRNAGLDVSEVSE